VIGPVREPLASVHPEEILGLIDYLVVEFPEGSTRPAPRLAFELTMLVESELIRILDLLIVGRRSDGRIDVVEYEELADHGGMPVLTGRLADVLSATDVEQLAATLARGSTGMVVVFEHSWAGPLTEVVRDCAAKVAASGRIATADLAAVLVTDPGGG
jgi:hypothetical protein